MKMYFFIFSAVILCSCVEENPNRVAAERLSKLYIESLETKGHPYHNLKNALELEKILEGLPPSIPIKARYEAAYEYLKAGNNDKVLELVRPVLAESEISNRTYEYHRIAAMAHLRKGEQENCFHTSGINACTLPFTDETRHKKKKEAQSAIDILQKMLSFRPTDLESKWLLNIASAAVAEQDLLSDDQRIHIVSPGRQNIKFQNSFTDHKMGHAGGSSLEDFDNDGDLDILVSSYHLDENVTYYENSGGQFTDKTRNLGLKGITGGLNFIHGDVNADGYMDVLILRGGWLGQRGNFPPSLLINDRGLKFLDKTEQWGLLNYAPTQTAVFADLDGDDDLDLVVGYERSSTKVYSNDGGQFIENNSSGIDFTGFTKGITCGDINNDGKMDIFISVLGGDNKLYINKGNMKFSDVSEEYGVQKPWASFVTWFFDYNNDGYEDLYVGGYNIDNKTKMIRETILDYTGDTTDFSHPVLYKNIGGKYFQDVTNEVGFNKELYAMGGNFGDVNNDGFLDIYLGTGEFDMWAVMPNRLFINEEGKRFVDHTFTSGLGMIQKGHGISFGDVDSDGDQDIFHTIGGAVEGDVFMNYLYENHSEVGQSITLKGMNMGTRVSIYVNDAAIHRSVSTGGSFGNNSIDLEVGIGNNDRIDSIKVGSCLFKDVKAGKQYTLDVENCEIDAL